MSTTTKLEHLWIGRNLDALDRRQIENCEHIWSVLLQSEEIFVQLDVSRAGRVGTMTGFNEQETKVYLGANVYEGPGFSANARLSAMACLAHELAHAQRHVHGRGRSKTLPEIFLDEAETSIEASFMRVLSRRDRRDLVEDAGDYLTIWMRHEDNTK